MSILPKTKNKPTYFGLLVSFAYWAFAKLGVDYAVIEVGMGGRLDATNVINSPAKVCTITDIGLDHTQFLGDTISKIAGEKAGIIQSHNAVFMHQQPDEVMAVMTQKARQEHAQLHVLQNNSSLVPENMPKFQQRNWSLAKAVVEYVIERDNLAPLDEQSWVISTDTVIPARMETSTIGNQTVILDGSHNVQKIGALVDAIKEKYKTKKVAVLVSFVEGRDTTLEDCLKVLHTISDRLIATSFTSTQDLHRLAIPTELIAEHAEKVGFESVDVVIKAEEALQKLLQSNAEVAVITGSFFLTHELRQPIQKRAK